MLYNQIKMLSNILLNSAKYERELYLAELKYKDYTPSDTTSVKEFFEKASPLGVLVAIRTKNQVYVRVNSYDPYTPPEIFVLLKKFKFNCRVGSLDKRSNIYYANARKHALEIYEVEG